MLQYRELKSRVIAEGGAMQVEMAELRDCEGVGKLGVHVLDVIKRHLEAVGLHTLERRLPNDQRATVWLISSETTLGELMLEIRAELRRAR